MLQALLGGDGGGCGSDVTGDWNSEVFRKWSEHAN